MRITIFRAHQPTTAANAQWHTRKMALQPIGELAADDELRLNGPTGSGQGGCNGVAARTSCHHLSWTMNGFGSLGVAGHALFATDAAPAPAVPVAAVVAPAAAVVAPAAGAVAVVAPAAPAAAVVAPATAAAVEAPATAAAVVAPATAAAVVTTAAAGAAAEKAGPSRNDCIGRRAGENTARTGSL
jgi:hypothetical protein